jgi:hypothetical protein
MMHRIMWLAAVAAAALAGAPATADVADYYSAGFWTAFSGTSNSGTPMCGVSTSGSQGRFIGIKYFRGSSAFTIHVIRDGWYIPGGTAVRVTLQFDNNSPWIASGSGSGQTIEMSVPERSMNTFFNEFRYASTLAITFNQGNEGRWIVRLRGTNAITAAFFQCVFAVGPARPTQPFGQ